MTASFQNNTLLKTLLTLGIITLFALIFTQNHDLLGDVNSDGSVDVQDVVLMVDIILNDGAGYSDDQLWASDVNEDSATDISDIVIIVDWIINPPEVTECPDDYSPCEDDSTQCCLSVTLQTFTWETDELGDWIGTIYDIAVIDENNIWAVGEISFQDSMWYGYNAARWDGNGWEVMRITFPPWNLYAPRSSIFAFDENDIWMGSNIPSHWDGSEWTGYFSQDSWVSGFGTITGIWGTSSSDMYFISNDGDIAHYDGETFELMASFPGALFKDIYGTDSDNIWAVGYVEGGFPFVSIVVHYDGISWNRYYYSEYNGNYWQTDTESNLFDFFQSVWCWEDQVFLAGGLGIWNKHTSDSLWTFTSDAEIVPDGLVINMLRGNNPNDMMVVGNQFKRIHFNGIQWTDVSDEIIPFQILKTVSIKNNLFVVGGQMPSIIHPAMVTRGYRE